MDKKEKIIKQQKGITPNDINDFIISVLTTKIDIKKIELHKKSLEGLEFKKMNGNRYNNFYKYYAILMEMKEHKKICVGKRSLWSLMLAIKFSAILDKLGLQFYTPEKKQKIINLCWKEKDKKIAIVY